MNCGDEVVNSEPDEGRDLHRLYVTSRHSFQPLDSFSMTTLLLFPTHHFCRCCYFFFANSICDTRVTMATWFNLPSSNAPPPRLFVPECIWNSVRDDTTAHRDKCNGGGHFKLLENYDIKSFSLNVSLRIGNVSYLSGGLNWLNRHWKWCLSKKNGNLQWNIGSAAICPKERGK